MSKTQELLQRMADAWNGDKYCSDYFLGAIHAIEAIPECYHSDVLDALFKPTKQEEDEQPEDYAAVKTFDSDEFHVGDEVTDGGYVGIVTALIPEFTVVMKDGSAGVWETTEWKRTGRNFPAISAILEALKK